MASVQFNKGALVKEPPHADEVYCELHPQGLEFCLQHNVYTVGLDYFFHPSLLGKLLGDSLWW